MTLILPLNQTLNLTLNPSVPDSLICVGARWRQIGGFRPLKSDLTRLRDRRMNWIVSKGRAAVFLSYIETEASVKSHVLAQFKKVCAMI